MKKLLKTQMMYLGSTLTNRYWLFDPFKFIEDFFDKEAEEGDFKMQTRMPILTP